MGTAVILVLKNFNIPILQYCYEYIFPQSDAVCLQFSATLSAIALQTSTTDVHFKTTKKLRFSFHKLYCVAIVSH